MTKTNIIIAVFIILIAAAGAYIFVIGDDKKAVQEAADLYIKAVRDRNFDIIYNLNASSQKRRLFVLKDSSADRDELLKRAYNEHKALFDSAQPVFGFNAIWVEKFIFITDMNYKIVDVVMERNIDNPTAFYRKRIDAAVVVEVEYKKKDTAPIYDGKNIKKAVYLVKMIHIWNITRAVKGIVVGDKWLFKGVAIKKDGNVVYWE